MSVIAARNRGGATSKAAVASPGPIFLALVFIGMAFASVLYGGPLELTRSAFGLLVLASASTAVMLTHVFQTTAARKPHDAGASEVHVGADVDAVVAIVMAYAAEATNAFARHPGCVLRTPLLHTPEFGPRTVVKLESEQNTNSFKARGALSALAATTAAQRARGVITASTGNHGLGIVAACAALAPPVTPTVYLPVTAVVAKVSRLETGGARLVFTPGGCDSVEAVARAAAAAAGAVFVSPYNDLRVIAGAATVAVELLDQMTQMAQSSAVGGTHPPHLDVIFVPVGGGGLISGIACGLRSSRDSPRCIIVGCQPAVDDAMRAAVESGFISAAPHAGGPTLSDGTAGGLEPGAVTLRFCSRLVDVWQTVTEAEIRGAMRQFYFRHGKVVEGAAGVALAVAARWHADGRLDGKAAAVVACGGNVDAAVMAGVLGSRDG